MEACTLKKMYVDVRESEEDGEKMERREEEELGKSACLAK